MKSAQIIDYLGDGPIDAALQAVRAESTVCIVSAITDLLLAGGDCGTILASIDPPLTAVRDHLFAFCHAKPEIFRLIPYDFHHLEVIWLLVPL